MADQRQGLCKQRQPGGDDRVAFQHALPGGGTDLDRIALLAHIGELLQAGDIDQPLRPRQPHRHQRHQGLAAGDEAHVVAASR